LVEGGLGGWFPVWGGELPLPTDRDCDRRRARKSMKSMRSGSIAGSVEAKREDKY
jgi:hypothetical protein